MIEKFEFKITGEEKSINNYLSIIKGCKKDTTIGFTKVPTICHFISKNHFRNPNPQ